jgi:hypothetical protein
MADLTGLADFLQDLRNQGMHPFLTGDIVKTGTRPAQSKLARKPYIVSKR